MQRSRKLTPLDTGFDWTVVRRKRPACQSRLRVKSVMEPQPEMAPALRWEELAVQPSKPAPWTEAEDWLIIALVKKLVGAPWKNIAMGVPGRDGDACRSRYHRVIKKSDKYAAHLPDRVRIARGQPAPEEQEADAAMEPSVVEMFGSDLLAVEMPLDNFNLADKFLFEEICGLGAMPHLSQPVPLCVAPPTSLAALPEFNSSSSPETVAVPSPPPCVKSGNISVHVLPRGLVARPRQEGNAVRIVPKTQREYTRASGCRAISSSIGFAHVDLADINKMINRPAPVQAWHRSSAIHKQKKKAAAAQSQVPGLVFNTQLVRPVV